MNWGNELVVDKFLHIVRATEKAQSWPRGSMNQKWEQIRQKLLRAFPGQVIDSTRTLARKYTLYATKANRNRLLLADDAEDEQEAPIDHQPAAGSSRANKIDWADETFVYAVWHAGYEARVHINEKGVTLMDKWELASQEVARQYPAIKVPKPNSLRQRYTAFADHVASTYLLGGNDLNMMTRCERLVHEMISSREPGTNGRKGGPYDGRTKYVQYSEDEDTIPVETPKHQLLEPMRAFGADADEDADNGDGLGVFGDGIGGSMGTPIAASGPRPKRKRIRALKSPTHSTIAVDESSLSSIDSKANGNSNGKNGKRRKRPVATVSALNHSSSCSKDKEEEDLETYIAKKKLKIEYKLAALKMKQDTQVTALKLKLETKRVELQIETLKLQQMEAAKAVQLGPVPVAML